MITAYLAKPTSPPTQLGGTTSAVKCGSGMLTAIMKTTGATASCAALVWSVEHQSWALWPVDPRALDPAVDGGFAIQRYVMPRGAEGIYCTYLRTTGAGTVTVSSEFSNP